VGGFWVVLGGGWGLGVGFGFVGLVLFLVLFCGVGCVVWWVFCLVGGLVGLGANAKTGYGG